MKTAWTFFWHFLVVLLVLALPTIGFGLWQGASLYYGESDTAYQAADEGPHIFQHGDHWLAQTLRGDREQGFWRDEQQHALTDSVPLDVVFPLDNSRFTVSATAEFVTPAIDYRDGQPIVAISDIEGNFHTFRQFLINAKVIDRDLNWTFAQGHLVLVGDMVDRGASTTQVLWFIYKLEQDAKRQGGQVHYILGNHELKNLHGNFDSAHEKYRAVAAMLGKQQHELFGDEAFLGRWLKSKNTIERINGVLFVHGGLHPALAERDYSLADLNDIVRRHYRHAWFPKRGADADDLLLNPETGPSWYRGYFKEDLSQAQVEQTLAKFDASAVVVGHTLQSEVNARYEKKVFAIDVKHPWDYRQGFPPRRSEGLLLEGQMVWRVRDDGSRIAL